MTQEVIDLSELQQMKEQFRLIEEKLEKQPKEEKTKKKKRQKGGKYLRK